MVELRLCMQAILSRAVCVCMHACVRARLQVCVCVCVSNEVLWWFHTHHTPNQLLSGFCSASVRRGVSRCVFVDMSAGRSDVHLSVSAPAQELAHAHTPMSFVSIRPSFYLTPQETMPLCKPYTSNWAFPEDLARFVFRNQ